VKLMLAALQLSPDAALVVAILIIGFVIWAFLK
jgi:preprotein translocase subunit Sec61beta